MVLDVNNGQPPPLPSFQEMFNPCTSCGVPFGAAHARYCRPDGNAHFPHASSPGSDSSATSCNRRLSVANGKSLYCDECRQYDCLVKGHRKKAKERLSRSEQRSVLQLDEDALNNYLEWEPGTRQSAGNSNSAGVEALKLNIMRASSILSIRYLEEGLKSAIRLGNEDQWRREVREMVQAAVTDESEDGRDHLLDGTWLAESDSGPCVTRPERNSKRCQTHGHEDHIKCRKQRRRERFHQRANEHKMRSRL